MRARIISPLALTICFAPSALAQVSDPVAAAQAPVSGVGPQYIGVEGETVNPADGSLCFDLPLQPPPGRQLSLA